MIDELGDGERVGHGGGHRLQVDLHVEVALVGARRRRRREDVRAAVDDAVAELDAVAQLEQHELDGRSSVRGRIVRRLLDHLAVRQIHIFNSLSCNQKAKNNKYTNVI